MLGLSILLAAGFVLLAVFGARSSTWARTAKVDATARLGGLEGSSFDPSRRPSQPHRAHRADPNEGGLIGPSPGSSAAGSIGTGDGVARASPAPPSEASRTRPASLVGLAFRPVTEAERKELSIPERWSGVVITDVRAGSSADEIDLRPLDVIVRVDKAKIETGKDLEQAVGENEHVVLTLIRSGFTFQRVLHRPFLGLEADVDATAREVAQVQSDLKAETEAQGQGGDHVRRRVGKGPAPAMERVR